MYICVSVCECKPKRICKCVCQTGMSQRRVQGVELLAWRMLWHSVTPPQLWHGWTELSDVSTPNASSLSCFALSEAYVAALTTAYAHWLETQPLYHWFIACSRRRACARFYFLESQLHFLNVLRSFSWSCTVIRLPRIDHVQKPRVHLDTFLLALIRSYCFFTTAAYICLRWDLKCWCGSERGFLAARLHVNEADLMPSVDCGPTLSASTSHQLQAVH